MNAPATPASPQTTDAQRSYAWRFVSVLYEGVKPAIEAARAAEGTPDAWKRADEVVRMIESVSAAARIARDTMPAPQGSPPDQLGWFKVLIQEQDAVLRKRDEAFGRLIVDSGKKRDEAFNMMIGDVAASVVRELDKRKAAK